MKQRFFTSAWITGEIMTLNFQRSPLSGSYDYDFKGQMSADGANSMTLR